MSGPATIQTPADGLSQALDALPLIRVHFLLIALVCIGHIFEAIELVMSSVFGTIYAPAVKAGEIESWKIGLLVAATGIGSALGSPLMGALADRWGRRNLLTAALCVVGGFSIAGALARDIDVLIATRVCAAIGIGCYVPLATTYLAEMIPARARGRAITANSIVAGVGGTLAGLLTAWFNRIEPFGLEGWRFTMIFAALGSIAIGLLLLRVPESPRWLREVGRIDEARKALQRLAGNALLPATVLEDAPERKTGAAVSAMSGDRAWTGERRFKLGFFILLSALLPWALVTLPVLGGAILANRGFGTDKALVFHSFVIAGLSIGSFLNLFIVDHVSRIGLLIGTANATAIATLLFSLSSSAGTTMAAGMLFTASVGVYHAMLLLVAAESFPPLLRGKVPAICFGVNRAFAIIVPLTMLPLLNTVGEPAVLAIVALAMIVSAGLLAAFGNRAYSQNTSSGRGMRHEPA